MAIIYPDIDSIGWGDDVNDNFRELSQNDTDIKTTIGTEEMGTTATTLKGAIKEHTSQLNEKAKDTDATRTTTNKTVTGAINELNTNKAIKPNTYSIGANGYFKDPTTSLILQWGRAQVTSTGTTITLPIAFPNGCVNVVASINFGSSQSAIFYNVLVLSKTQIQLWSNSATAYYYNWIAIGY